MSWWLELRQETARQTLMVCVVLEFSDIDNTAVTRQIEPCNYAQLNRCAVVTGLAVPLSGEHYLVFTLKCEFNIHPF
jgi:hypothetical protein